MNAIASLFGSTAKTVKGAKTAVTETVCKIENHNRRQQAAAKLKKLFSGKLKEGKQKRLALNILSLVKRDGVPLKKGRKRKVS